MTIIYAGGLWPLLMLGLLTDGVMALLWLCAMTGIGLGLLRLFRFSFSSAPALHLATSCALGIGAVSLLVLALGLVGALNFFVAWFILLTGLAACGLAALRAWKPPRLRDRSTSAWSWLLLILAPILGIALVAAFIPPGILWGDEPHGYDVVSYHFQIPREWHEAGRISPLEHNVFSFFPFNVEMHYLLAMHLRGGAWAGMYLAQLMHVAMTLITVVAIYGSVQHRGPAAAALAAGAGGAVPWILLLAPIGYNEGGLLLFGALAIGLTMRALREPIASWRTLALAGAMAGFAAGTKLTAVPMLILSLPVAIVIAAGRTRLISRQLWIGAAAYIVASIVTFSPWLVRNIAWTGNPVFPQAMNLFGRGHFSEQQVERWSTAHAPRADQRSIGARLHALGQQVMWDWRYGYVLVPLALLAAVAGWSRESRLLLAMLAMLALIWLFATHLQSRFFVLAIPILALMLAQLARGPLKIATGLVIVMAIAGLAQWDGRHGLSGNGIVPNAAAAGALGLADLSPLSPFDVSTLPEDAHVALVGDAQAFIYPLPMSRLHYRTVFDVDARDGDVIAAWLEGAPAHAILVVDPNSLARFSATYRSIPAPPRDIMVQSAPFVLER